MGRIRTIKPEFTESETIGRLSRDARLLFVQLWTFVDDSGRARAASRMLASRLYPYDDDAAGLIDGWLDELEREGCITRYEVNGSRYLQVSKWADHQKIDRPTVSKFPPPPCARVDNNDDSASTREDSRGVGEDSTTDLGSRTMDLGPGTMEEDQDFAPSGAATWDDIGARLSGLYGGIGWQSKSGDPLAWAGQCIGLLGKHSHDDPAMAAGLVDAFGASGEVKYAPKPKDLPPVLGKWLANGGSKGAVINV